MEPSWADSADRQTKLNTFTHAISNMPHSTEGETNTPSNASQQEESLGALQFLIREAIPGAADTSTATPSSRSQLSVFGQPTNGTGNTTDRSRGAPLTASTSQQGSGGPELPELPAGSRYVLVATVSSAFGDRTIYRVTDSPPADDAGADSTEQPRQD